MQIRQIIALALITGMMMAGSTAWADDCGKKHRVELPGCAWHNFTDYWFTVSNGCDYEITVKVDRIGEDLGLWRARAPDFRYDVPAGESRTESFDKTGTVDSVKCCPNYNKCS